MQSNPYEPSEQAGNRKTKKQEKNIDCSHVFLSHLNEVIMKASSQVYVDNLLSTGDVDVVNFTSYEKIEPTDKGRRRGKPQN